MAKIKWVVALLVIVLAAVGVGVYAHFKNAVPTKDGAVPPVYQQLSPGMTQAQVIALVGQPKTKNENPLFEKRTPQEWAKIQADSDAYDAMNGNPQAIPSAADLRAGALLPHEVKETWRYEPNALIFVSLKFDGSQKLMSWYSGWQPQARK